MSQAARLTRQQVREAGASDSSDDVLERRLCRRGPWHTAEKGLGAALVGKHKAVTKPMARRYGRATKT